MRIVSKYLKMATNSHQFETHQFENHGDKAVAIILTGKLNAGKDTVADMLQQEHGFTHRIAFADIVRSVTIEQWNFFSNIVSQALGPTSGVTWPLLSMDDCLGRNTKEVPLVLHLGDRQEIPLSFNGKPVTPRFLLQYNGSDICRKFMGPNVWVRAALEKIPQSARRIVFTDGRFPEELVGAPETLRSAGFAVETWRIINPTEPLDATTSTHVSETAVDDIATDRTIINDKSRGLNALSANVREAVTSALGCSQITVKDT